MHPLNNYATELFSSPDCKIVKHSISACSRNDKYNNKVKKYLVDYEDEEESYQHDEEKEVHEEETEADKVAQLDMEVYMN